MQSEPPHSLGHKCRGISTTGKHTQATRKPLRGGQRGAGQRGFPVILVTQKRTLERRQVAQDLALVLLGPWAVLIGMLPSLDCGWSPREEMEGI